MKLIYRAIAATLSGVAVVGVVCREVNNHGPWTGLALGFGIIVGVQIMLYKNH